jgi:hypothetical protein
MRRLCLAGLMMMGLISGWAQFTYTIDQSIPVEIDGRSLSMAWAGGLNSAQVNTMDLNSDGEQDLVVFDRTTNKLYTYLKQGSGFTYAPEYETLFPENINQWLLLRDFNCDGRKDVFTSDPFGIKVFVNITPSGGKLTWRLYDVGFLRTKGFSGFINLQVNSSDIPSIDDVDGDGDLDVLTVRFVGIGSIEWHKNLSVERTGICDSMQLERVTQVYGGVTECSCGVFAFNGQPCPSGSAGRSQHAGGKSLLMVDLDDDGDRDLLFSEESCARMYALSNVGTKESPLFQSFSVFPASSPAAMSFPAAFYEDVDGDQIRDLLVSPNLGARQFSSTDFEQSLFYYKNNGTNTIPNLTLQQRDFLQHEMIDVGDLASPAFFDMDGDGDQDLLIGTYLQNGFVGTIRYYENTGAPATPSFRLQNNDFFGLSDFNIYNIKPQFADINADTKPDLVLTATSTINGLTSVYFIPNTSNTTAFSGQTLEKLEFTIASTENITLVDVNQDGLMDLLVGRNTGAINYYRNTGTAASSFFVLDTDAYLGFGISTSRQNPALTVSDVDGDGSGDLLVCTQRGILSIVSDFRNNNQATELTEILHDAANGLYVSRNLGGRIIPAVVNIFNTARPSIVLGTSAGGLLLLKNENAAPLPEEPVVQIFPNPADRTEVVNVRADRNVTISFYTVLGQAVSSTYLVQANQDYPFQMQPLAPGLYIVRIGYLGKTFSQRLVIF